MAVDLDPRALDHLLRSPRGPVGQHVERVTKRVYERVKQTTPVAPSNPLYTGGTLKRKTIYQIAQDRGGPFGRVVANTRYAMYVARGTRPHIIRARRAKALRFYWRGKVQFRRSVRHPGTKPNGYLVAALKAVRRG